MLDDITFDKISKELSNAIDCELGEIDWFDTVSVNYVCSLHPEISDEDWNDVMEYVVSGISV